MEVDDPWMISFLIIATIATLCTLSVLFHLFRYGNLMEIFYRLVAALHLTLLVEEVSTLPYILSWDLSICKIMGFLHFYSGLANVIVVTFVAIYILVHVSSSEKFKKTIKKNIKKQAPFIIFGFPLIALLPFSTNSYGVSNSIWCTLPSSNKVANHWATGIFYGWVWLFIFIIIAALIYAVTKVGMKKGMEEVRNNVFSSVGIYVVITTVCWIPRAAPRFAHLFVDFVTSDTLYIGTNGALYISGIGYAVCYVIDVYKQPNPRRRQSSLESEGMSIDAEKAAQILSGDSLQSNLSEKLLTNEIKIDLFINDKK